MGLEVGHLGFGLVRIAWQVPQQMTPLGIAHWALNGHRVYCLNSDLHYTIGRGANAIHLKVPMLNSTGERWTFDGASIPWYIDLLPGFDKLGWHVWGVIPHDKCCEDGDEFPRAIGDAIFLEVLKNSKPDKYWQGVAMYSGVRLYSIGKAWRNHGQKEHSQN
jgi:hypothetical protein